MAAAAAHASPKLPAGCRPAPAIEGRAVTSEAAERLRLSPGTGRLAHAGEYRLRDGRVLLQPDTGGDGTIFSAADFARRETLVIDALRFRHVAADEGFHPLRGLIDDGDRFPSQVDALAQSLTRRLVLEGLPGGDPGVDALAARWREARCRPDAALFRELTAWAGRAALAKFSAEPFVPKKAAWATHRPGSQSGADLPSFGELTEPLVEGTFKSLPRALAPWEIAMRLLDEDGASLATLVDETLAAAPYVPVAPMATTSPSAPVAPASPNVKVEIRTPLANPGIDQ